jgi:cyclohexyl-isocyanide hydratase
MKIAYIIFDGVTWLDLIGAYDPLGRLKSLGYLPDLEWDICAYTAPCRDHFGLSMKPTKINESLKDYDVLFVPGGYGTRALKTDTGFLDWIKTAADAKYKISVCTGSLILGAAGFLTNKRATTHFAEYETLRPYCKELVKERIVEDGDTITAGAVSTSIVLGLHLCKKWAGEAAAEDIRTRLDFRQ